MMNETLHMILLIVVMATVTYLIRMIPFVFFKRKIKSNFIKNLFYYIPYAVLASMTFPAIFYSTGNLISASVGTFVALIASLNKKSLVVVVAVLAVIAVLITNGILLTI